MHLCLSKGLSAREMETGASLEWEVAARNVAAHSSKVEGTQPPFSCLKCRLHPFSQLAGGEESSPMKLRGERGRAPQAHKGGPRNEGLRAETCVCVGGVL